MQVYIQSISQVNTKQFFLYVNTGIGLAARLVPSTSCAHFDTQKIWLGFGGTWTGSDIGYDVASMAKQLNSESVKR